MPSIRNDINPAWEANFGTIAGDKGSRLRSAQARDNLYKLLTQAFSLKNIAAGEDAFNGTTDFTSGEYTAPYNALLTVDQKMRQLLTANPKLLEGMSAPDWLNNSAKAVRNTAQKAWIWGTNSENKAGPLAAALDAKDYPQPPPPTPFDISAFKRPAASSASPANMASNEMYSLPYTPMPAPPMQTPFLRKQAPMPAPMPGSPELSPFVQATPPRPNQLPMPTAGVAPDYSKFEEFMKSATPKKSTVDWEKQKAKEAFAAMGNAVANWNPNTEWGGLLAGAGAGFASGAVANSHNKAASEDAYQKALEDFAAKRASFAAQQAGDAAQLTNSNNSRMDSWRMNDTQQGNAYAVDKYNTETANGKNAYETVNANQQNRYNDAVSQTARNNQQSQLDYEREQQNLASIHDASIQNGASMYKYAVDEAQRTAPQIQNADSHGATILTTEGGKQKLVYHPFRDYTASEHIKKIKDAYGDESPQVKLAVVHDQLASGDTLSLSQAMVQDAVDNAYAQEIFGPKYDEAKQQVTAELPGNPGTKEYAAQYSRAMAANLLGSFTLADKEMLMKFATKGSLQAQYLLQGTAENQSGVPDNGR